MMEFDLSAIVDDVTKVIYAACSIGTFVLLYRRALPRIDTLPRIEARIEEIHAQTNGLTEKAEAGARAVGVKEGLEQAAAVQVVTAQAIGSVVDIATDKMLAAAKLAKEGDRSDGD